MDTLELITHRFTLILLLMSLMGRVAAQIDDRAPVKTRDTVVIDDPVERVWQIMTTIADWPQHFDFIRETQAPARLRAGESFRWRTTRLTLTSHLLTVAPTDTLGWQGGRYGITVRHYWYFQALPSGRTRVVSAESQRGLLVGLFRKRFQRSLREGSVKWLLQLKRTCETGR